MDEPARPYNPLDRVELGKSVERALLARPLVQLGDFLTKRPKKFSGAGLYALYYVGDLSCYEPIAPPRQPPGEIPIYVGRARPKGARQGALGLESTTNEPVLFSRLREHARSIATTEEGVVSVGGFPLAVSDFLCRYLVADDIWVPLGEALLIGHYRPVWNVVVDGFGNHAPGGGREKQSRSSWDTLHPGRNWAFRLPEAMVGLDDLVQRITRHFAETGSPDLDTAPTIDDQVRQAILGESDA